jgi:hypothetical protein
VTDKHGYLRYGDVFGTRGRTFRSRAERTIVQETDRLLADIDDLLAEVDIAAAERGFDYGSRDRLDWVERTLDDLLDEA